MDALQLDSLLESKINRSRSAKHMSFVAVVALCLLLVVAAGAGIYYLANRETPEVPGETIAADEPEQSSDAQQPEQSSANSATDREPSAGTDTDSSMSVPEADTPVPDSVREDGLYTHSLQVVWFEEPLHPLPEELNISVSYDEDIITEFTLTPENGWQYTWKDAYSANDLVLQGDFPQDITAVFSVSGQNFTVTGSYSEPHETEDAETSDEKSGGTQELPRTGMTWPFGLLLAGLMLVIAGVSQKRAQSSRE